MFRKTTAFLLLLAAAFTNSCETDFSLNGEYEVNPVVFGLLDHTADFHTFKITKAFLGDDDNLVYAQNPDSSYFSQIDAKVIEYKNSSPTGREWTLFDTIMTNKDTSGLFYGPEQKVYAFSESDLDSTAEYELIVDIEGGKYQVTGRTALIDNFGLSGFNVVPSAYKIDFAPNTVDEDSDYNDWKIKVNEGMYAKRYNYKYTFTWTETYADMSTQTFSATRNNGDQYQSINPETPSVQYNVFSGLDFYQWVASVVPDDSDVIKRQMNSLDITVSVAHQELDQYMSVGEPVSGIAQVQPEFTNLTGGRGLFSARVVKKVNGFLLNSSSMKELCTGLYTGGKLFCSDYIEHAGENFYCP
ncbi:hypothetical protein K6119_01150 [Paracrocinitomix mangrovi]|uniref:hypothetical protein n=1 Tax=Paracrocinitomix mangrovi TaxID=2862509 RepID=UPI001C8E3DE9|nr:hypothetical protein [Paracrocinitomix mangrovi]UKN02122.1 hypothetical protein K6119_01150 [Paracrocinitomix mangrovi]